MAEEGLDPPFSLADVGVARATSGVARIGFHTKATQKRQRLTRNTYVPRALSCHCRQQV